LTNDACDVLVIRGAFSGTKSGTVMLVLLVVLFEVSMLDRTALKYTL
jgi:hypothetical protein